MREITYERNPMSPQRNPSLILTGKSVKALIEFYDARVSECGCAMKMLCETNVVCVVLICLFYFMQLDIY